MILEESYKKEIIAIIKKVVPTAHIFVYGSRVSGTTKPFSDIDVVIKNETSLDLNTIGLLREELSESNLPYRVDISDWSTLTPDFQKTIADDLEELKC